MFIVVISLSLYSSFFFFHFAMVFFYLFFSFFFSMLSAPLPLTNKTKILRNYHYEITNLYVYTNVKLIRDYYIALSIGKKNVDFSLCIVALYVKAIWNIS